MGALQWRYVLLSAAALAVLVWVLVEDNDEISDFPNFPLSLLYPLSSNLVAATSALSALLADDDASDDAMTCDSSSISACHLITNTHCGWCWDDNTPRRGGHRGDAAGNCSDWTWYANRCAAHYDCGLMPTCIAILGTACGWCGAANRGMRGGVRGPTADRCGGGWIFDYSQCPIREDPQQVHLMWGEDETVMVVTWASAFNWSLSRALYIDAGAEEAQLQQVEASVRQFVDHNRAGLHFIHRANLTGLVPGHPYVYWLQVGRHQSRNFSFRAQHRSPSPSSAASAPPAPPQRFIVFGDMGRYGGAPALHSIEAEVLSAVKTSSPVTALIHIGDFAYDLQDADGINGDAFMSRIESVASTVPYLTCPGNHEIEDDNSYSNYRNRFSMPNSWSHDGYDMWYSINVGLIHFVSYSTEQLFTHPGEVSFQLDFLRRDLATANLRRHLQPWIVAFGHRPMYCSNDDGDDCTTDDSIVRHTFESLFDSYGVDLVLEAHEHSYERLYPVYDTVRLAAHYDNPLGCVHIVTGTAGCNEQGGVCINAIPGPRGDWSAFHIANRLMYGYGHLQAFNETHLYWDEVLAEEGSSEHRLDTIWIVQERHGNFSRRREEEGWKRELTITIQ